MGQLGKSPRNRLSPDELWRREESAARRRKWEDLLDLHIRTWGLPEPQAEYRFDETRRWRFDRAWPELKVAVEVDGVLPGVGGRHQRPAGYERDAEKHNAAQLQGWTVLHFTPTQIKSGYAIRQIEAAMRKD